MQFIRLIVYVWVRDGGVALLSRARFQFSTCRRSLSALFRVGAQGMACRL